MPLPQTRSHYLSVCVFIYACTHIYIYYNNSPIRIQYSLKETIEKSCLSSVTLLGLQLTWTQKKPRSIACWDMSTEWSYWFLRGAPPDCDLYDVNYVWPLIRVWHRVIQSGALHGDQRVRKVDYGTIKHTQGWQSHVMEQHHGASKGFSSSQWLLLFISKDLNWRETRTNWCWGHSHSQAGVGKLFDSWGHNLVLKFERESWTWDKNYIIGHLEKMWFHVNWKWTKAKLLHNQCIHCITN